MAIPGWQEILLPLLSLVKDEQEHKLASCKALLADTFQLSHAERMEPSPSGKHRVFDNRVEWAKFYLAKAKLIESTGHGQFRITPRGTAILDIEPKYLTMKFLFIFDEFVQFRNPSISRVFVSHSSDTIEFCRVLVQGLRAKNMNVWFDESNLQNGSVSEEIENELLACDTFLLILSPKAIVSPWVRQEYQAALDLVRSGSIKSFIPVVALECEIPLFIRTYKAVAIENFHAIEPQSAIKQIIAIITTAQQNTGTGKPIA